ncbi:uncharacterized protein Z518_11007 [Rhinocladiella mackenziei CBS 650.93]|uniref:Rhinocladiella mackenziei CBS 650.93 unplaced genomic scaffold supercont1.11, whole genome shotgun sequence n=1 Tax=Rhinocladiella mackenziei CBS 650.93 TaxID=1442369 RepID=A0A0D2IS85_9EURO|nr:uncharacterized protein Z518_11007 [Rhinocladiella mackenziei CBS 650.93]KIW99594.1 hypothetical protein Z518_11007 [Rhinocladiella mackenziei CBS 650.93]
MNVGQQVPSDPRLSIFRSRTWLRNCLQHHHKTGCNSNPKGIPQSMPKRLLFLGNTQNQIRLVDDFDGGMIPYLALSYCWGTSQYLITTSHNYEQQRRNIRWSSLPATYRDAIEFTRAIGYRYLWIDALCIIQDDKEDWNHEASHMADIYSEAVLVISAANANHVGFGFFHERLGSRSFKNKLKRGPDEPTHVLVQEPTIHSNIIGNPGIEEQWPVFRRAWTLQERMLATRLVHFTTGEIIWECASMCACECGHLEATNAVTSRRRYDLSSLDRISDTERANLWDELGFSYQNRLITQDKDRLSALSGLAHRFQNDGLGQYLAGFWSNFAISMLLWEVKKGRKATEYIAPSWSWASIHGRLARNDSIEPNDRFDAILEDCGSEPATTDPYGPILEGSGYVTLSSPCIDGMIVRSDRNGHPMVQLTTEIQAFLVSDVHLKQTQIGARVKCLFPRGLEAGPSGQYIEALVLIVSRNMQDYERVGIAHVQKYSLKNHQDHGHDIRLVTQTVKIC